METNSIFTDSKVVSNPFDVRGYARMLMGNFVGTLALWTVRLALAFYVWNVSGSAFWSTAVVAAQFIPSAAFGPLFGVIVDRVRFRAALVAAVAVTFSGYLATMACFMLGIASPWTLCLTSLWLGLGGAMYTPVRLVLPTVVVPKSALAKAIANSAISFNLTRVLGPLLGAVLISLVGVSSTVLFAVCCYVFFIVVVTTLPFASPQTSTEQDEASFRRRFLAGARYVLSSRDLRLYLVITVLGSMFVRTFGELVPAINGIKFAGTELGLSLLTTALAVGAILCGLAFSLLRQSKDLVIKAMLLGLWVGPLTGLVLVFGDAFWLILICLIVNGFMSSMAGLGSQTLLQTSMDSSFRARVMSIWASLTVGTVGLSASISGAAIDLVGFETTLIALTIIGTAVGWYLTLRHWPNAKNEVSNSI